MRKPTEIFLNTWKAYNEGSIGYGWFTPEAARDYIDADPERDGGEWFIADIDNYLGVDFGNLDYANVDEVIESIQALEELDDYELNEAVAIMEYRNCDVAEAVDNLGNYSVFEDLDAYHNSCDEMVDYELEKLGTLACYFDYEAYHRDCDYDVFEASNGVVILG